ncbi:flagellar filament capping protein FliD [Opitutus terrae]|uniref:Flagellar hook-associated protein 2 n=1 Tax=Opitutus terrae (strain DSM 11246 / JCM 15787 / PB90-1) TaxID=452637 RepID=B1ZRP1_OPITP|nr:flagellar filament capping protein FliD [Opitutus terrae]ACB73734.1 flagellar hook-associated 2 domain protein [Opitutus terrae PB90-1]
MAGITISGLVSNSFDWKSVVDQLIAIEKQPIARLQTEESKNIDKISSFTGLKTGLEGLQTATKALSAEGLFDGRSATSTTSGSGWTATAASGTAIGSYAIAVSQLASAARRVGASSISTSLNAAATDLGTDPNGIAGLTLATLPTAAALTSGDSTFTINGQQITINSADSLQSVFDGISSATNGEVTASYDATTDKITLSSSGEIVLGAANDTSNFLSVMRLANNGTGTISSTTSLGSVSLSAKLATSRLAGSLSGVDAEGDGAFTINGTTIDYNVNNDSIASLLTRITNSNAGVTASYDTVADRVILTNKSTGDTGMSVSDVTGSLASALGLTSGATTVRGLNAQFTVNNGDVLSSSSNVLGEDALGVDGLSVTVSTEGTQTINVAANTTAMKSAIQSFITAFNAVQSYIDDETKIEKKADGSISTGVLAGNHEVDRWSSQLRSLAFGQVSGLTGTVKRLEDLGIDFNSEDATLSIKDSAKLDAALSTRSGDVAAFFGGTTTGLVGGLNNYLGKLLDTSTGPLTTQVKTLNNQNTDLEEQIAALNRRIEQERERLTSAFIAMQQAQSEAQTQQKTLDSYFNKSKQE